MYGPSDVPHSCGHVVSWTAGEGYAGAWLAFVQVMYGLPCPWCGGESGAAAPADVDEILLGNGPNGLGTLTATRTGRSS